MAKKTYNGVEYDDALDYSVAIETAKANGEDTSALEASRMAKISDPTGKYNGIEPTMYGSDLTYSQAVGNGDTGAIANALKLYEQYNPKTPAPANESTISPEIDSMLNKILNREEFSYDHTTDPSYQAYEQQYKRLGDRAREDTLGDIAGLTGGYASSWAASAASQAQNDYNQQLSAIIPELREAAYNRYMDDYNRDVTNLGLLMDVDNTAYNRDMDAKNQALTKWQMTGVADDSIANALGIQTGATTMDWEKFDWNKTVDEWNMSNTESQQKINQLMTKWQMTGVADEEIAKELGVPVGSTTESYYFNKISSDLDAQKVALSEQELALSQKEVNEANANKQTTINNIIRNTQNKIIHPDPYDADSDADYTNAAQFLYNAVYMEGLPINDYFSIGAQAGIPTSVLNSTFDSLYNEAMNEALNDGSGGEQDYTYYAALMGQQEDPEAWLTANKYSIPADILEDLTKLINIDF